MKIIMLCICVILTYRKSDLFWCDRCYFEPSWRNNNGTFFLKIAMI